MKYFFCVIFELISSAETVKTSAGLRTEYQCMWTSYRWREFAFVINVSVYIIKCEIRIQLLGWWLKLYFMAETNLFVSFTEGICARQNYICFFLFNNILCYLQFWCSLWCYITFNCSYLIHLLICVKIECFFLHFFFYFNYIIHCNLFIENYDLAKDMLNLISKSFSLTFHAVYDRWNRFTRPY